MILVTFSSQFSLVMLLPLMSKNFKDQTRHFSPKTILKITQTHVAALSSRSCRSCPPLRHSQHFSPQDFLPRSLPIPPSYLPQDAAFLVQNTPSPLCFISFIRLSLLPHDQAETHLHCTSFFDPCLHRLCLLASLAATIPCFDHHHRLQLLSTVLHGTISSSSPPAVQFLQTAPLLPT